MWWIKVVSIIGGIVLLLVIVALVTILYKAYNKNKNGIYGRSVWLPKHLSYGNFGTVKCIPSNLNRTDSSSSSSTEYLPQAETSSGYPGILVPTSVQPVKWCDREPSLQSLNLNKGSSKSSSTVEGSSKDSEDDEDIEWGSCSKGKIWFSAKNNEHEQTLTVEIIKAKYLRGKSMLYSPRNPLVRVYLLPDESNFYQTKVRHKILSPKFKETFVFKLTSEPLSTRSLKLVVYDFDKKNVRHSLGHTIIPLAKIDVANGTIQCQELDNCPQRTYAGEMLLGLSCNPYTDKLKVTIVRLINLMLNNNNGGKEDVFIKIQLYHGRRLIKNKNSLMHPGNSAIEIQESFTLGVSGRILDSCSVVITVMSRKRGDTKDVALGRIIVGPFTFARGRELAHWQEMISNPRTNIEKWHALCG